MRRRLAACALCAALSAAGAARAADDGFGVQGFHVAPGYGSFLTVEGASVPPGFGGGIGGLVGYQFRPLVIRGCARVEGDSCAEWTDDRTAVVEHYLSVDLYGSLSLFRIFEVGVAIPAIPYQTGDDAPNGARAPSSKVGLGDIPVHVKLDLLHMFGYAGDFAGLALVPVVTIPVGDAIDGDSYMGEGMATVHPKVAVGLAFPRARLGLDVGYLWRRATEFALAEVGPCLTFGAAVEILFTGRVGGIVELFGRNGFSADPAEAPLEADVALRLKSEAGLAFTAGGGAGIVGGVGTPAVRAFLGLAWMRPVERDADGDGVGDREDRCPAAPEDRDGFEDGDGCPDADDDGDGVPDGADRCPREAEDRDGFEDGDGCPDADDDGDGVPDGADACPHQVEDRDGFEDGDGCPDPDNDGDRLLDAEDRCPDEAETVDGREDGDGCPDAEAEPAPAVEAPKLAEVRDDRIVVAEEIHFETGQAKIGRESFATLDAMAGILAGDPAIRLRIEGHTDSRGKAEFNRQLSARRAKAVLEYLAGRGIAADRMTAEGFGPDRPLSENDTAEGRAKNRRVEFHITGR